MPPDLTPGSQEIEQYLNVLNAELLTHLQKSGEAFPGIVIRIGREVDAALRPAKK